MGRENIGEILMGRVQGFCCAFKVAKGALWLSFLFILQITTTVICTLQPSQVLAFPIKHQEMTSCSYASWDSPPPLNSKCKESGRLQFAGEICTVKKNTPHHPSLPCNDTVHSKPCTHRNSQNKPKVP